MNKIQEGLKASIESLDRCRTKYLRIGKASAPYQERLEDIATQFGGTLYVIADCIIVSVPVKSFRDIGETLIAVETLVGCDFDLTSDSDSYRKFSCSKTDWIRVDAEVGQNDANDPTAKCKRVPTGEFNTYPVYKLVCEE